MSGCKKEIPPDLTPELERVRAELDSANRKIAASERSFHSKQDELELANASIQSTRKQLADQNQLILQRDAQIRTLQQETDALRKRDAFAFADITALHQEGRPASALSRYEQFVKDHPNSSLVPHANRAIAELSAKVQDDVSRKLNPIDPKRQERELLKRFNEGILTPEELAPILKRKTVTEVISVLGKPNQTFLNGTELGYKDKVTNSATGRKGMLIVSFEAGRVVSLRIDYAGRKIVP